jgi:hypothetical protein
MHVRMLFINYVLAFNTIMPSKLTTKLAGLNFYLCNWVLDFMTGCPQVVKVGNITSSTLILKTGAPQLCILSPLLYIHDCMASHSSNSIIKFADDTTVVGLITNKMAYREEVGTDGVVPGKQPLPQRLQIKGADCGLLEEPGWAHPIVINGATVETVKNVKFLSVHISWELKCEGTTATLQPQEAEEIQPVP